MAINKKDCISIEYEEGTIGGKTYYVKHKSWDEERAICFRLVRGIPGYGRQGMHCTKPAGFGTDHVGEGACRLHGGNNHLLVKKNSGITHGQRSNITQKSLARRIDDFIEKDKQGLLDLTYELGAIKLLFQDLISLFPEDADDPDYKAYVQRAVSMINSISALVDRVSRVEARNTLTANQVIYLRATVADILMKYLPDVEMRSVAVKELLSRFPGGDTDVINGEAVRTQILDGG